MTDLVPVAKPRLKTGSVQPVQEPEGHRYPDDYVFVATSTRQYLGAALAKGFPRFGDLLSPHKEYIIEIETVRDGIATCLVNADGVVLWEAAHPLYLVKGDTVSIKWDALNTVGTGP